MQPIMCGCNGCHPFQATESQQHGQEGDNHAKSDEIVLPFDYSSNNKKETNKKVHTHTQRQESPLRQISLEEFPTSTASTIATGFIVEKQAERALRVATPQVMLKEGKINMMNTLKAHSASKWNPEGLIVETGKSSIPEGLIEKRKLPRTKTIKKGTTEQGGEYIHLPPPITPAQNGAKNKK